MAAEHSGPISPHCGVIDIADDNTGKSLCTVGASHVDLIPRIPIEPGARFDRSTVRHEPAMSDLWQSVGTSLTRLRRSARSVDPLIELAYFRTRLVMQHLDSGAQYGSPLEFARADGKHLRGVPEDWLPMLPWLMLAGANRLESTCDSCIRLHRREKS